MVKIKGLREAKENLDKLASIGDRISFADLFPSSFVSEHTRFETMEELFQSSGFKVDSEDDLKAIPDNEWEQHIIENTKFDSWLDMQKTAFNSVISNKLKN